MANKLEKSFRDFDKSISKEIPQIPGELGISINGHRRTEVPNRGQYVYVRLRSNLSEVVQAFNEKVFPGYNLPVLVQWNNNRYEITGRDVQRYPEWEADNPYIARHGNTHSLDVEGREIGTDPVWVYPYQFMPSLVSPFDVNLVENVYIHPYTINYNGEWKTYGNTGTPSILSYSPTTGKSLVLVTVDGDTGNPALFSTTGTFISESVSGVAGLVSYLPVVNTQRYLPLAFVELSSGTSSVGWHNTYDVRQFLSSGAGSGEYKYIDFDTNGAPAPETLGRLSWNADENTLDLGVGDNVVGQLLHELFFDVKNQTGSTIADGTPVMFAGTLGASGKLLIQEAIANSLLSSEHFMGITTHEIGDGESGKVTWFGKVRGIDTTGATYGETWSDGDLIWLSQTSLGGLTNVEPSSGQKILIAAVVNAHSNGTLIVRPTWANTSASSSGSGGIDISVDGYLSVLDPVATPILIIKDGTEITTVHVYIEDTGSSGDTVFDLYLLAGGSVLSSPITIPYNSVSGWASVSLSTTLFDEGDILVPKLTSVADGAVNMRVYLTVPSGGSGGGGSISVNNISPVSNIDFDGTQFIVNDLGSGVVSVEIDESIFPVVPEQLSVHLETKTVSSAVASLDFTSVITGNYDIYDFYIDGLVPATNNVDFRAVYSVNNGSSWDTTQVYANSIFMNTNATTVVAGRSPGFPNNYLTVRNGGDIGNLTYWGMHGRISLLNPNSTTKHKLADVRLSYQSSAPAGNLNVINSMCKYANTAVVNAVKFYFSSGNIASGRISLFGRKIYL